MINKPWSSVSVIIIFIVFVSYFIIRANSNYNHFYKNKIDAKIIKVENYEDKSLNFYYDKKYLLVLGDASDDTLKVGDSISKKMNTYKFAVFRTNENGDYRLLNNYICPSPNSIYSKQ